MKCGLWKYHKSPFLFTLSLFLFLCHHPLLSTTYTHTHIFASSFVDLSRSQKILFSPLLLQIENLRWRRRWCEYVEEGVYYYTFHARSHEDENEVRNLCFYDFVCLCAEFFLLFFRRWLKVRCIILCAKWGEGRVGKWNMLLPPPRKSTVRGDEN